MFGPDQTGRFAGLKIVLLGQLFDTGHTRLFGRFVGGVLADQLLIGRPGAEVDPYERSVRVSTQLPDQSVLTNTRFPTQEERVRLVGEKLGSQLDIRSVVQFAFDVRVIQIGNERVVRIV
jgi:hypothetical protein